MNAHSFNFFGGAFGSACRCQTGSNKALFGFNSGDDLWRQESITGESELPLRWNKSVEDLPILRNVTMEEGVTEDPMSKWTFLRIFCSTLRSAGYLCGSSIHQIRRYLGKKVDGKLCFSLLEIYYMCELY
jgi:hypothetical protein